MKRGHTIARAGLGGLAVAGALVAAVAGAPTTAQATYLGYPDLDAGQWYVDGGVVDWSEEHGVINGDGAGNWLPNGRMDRGQAASILYNWSGDPRPTESATFADAGTFAWAADGIAWAQDEGVFNGNAHVDGTVTMDPWSLLSREQAASVLYNMLGDGERPDPAALDSFDDGDRVSAWAVDGVAWAVENGVMGNGGYLAPASGCTRAEFVAMLMNAVEGEAEPEPTPDPEPGGENPGDETDDPGEGGGVTDPEGPGGAEGPGTTPGGSEEPGGDQTEDPAPIGSYDLEDGTWILRGSEYGKSDGYYNNRAFCTFYTAYSSDSTKPGTGVLLYNADLEGDGASVTSEDGTALKQGVNFSVSRTFNEAAKTITTTVTGINGSTGSLSVTESVHVADALIYTPLTCGGADPDYIPDSVRYADGRSYYAYRLVGKPYEVTQGWTSGIPTMQTSNEGCWYDEIGDVVCDWFDGEMDADGVLTPTEVLYNAFMSPIGDFPTKAYCDVPYSTHANEYGKEIEPGGLLYGRVVRPTTSTGGYASHVVPIDLS